MKSSIIVLGNNMLVFINLLKEIFKTIKDYNNVNKLNIRFI